EILLDALGDEGSGTLAPDQQAAADQPFERLADGDSRHREILGQVALRGQSRLGLDRARFDRMAQPFLEPPVERTAARFGFETNLFGEAHWPSFPPLHPGL